MAARRNYKEIGMKEIEDAMVKVTMGPEKKTRVRSEKENRLVAYHEAGHAVVSRFLPTKMQFIKYQLFQEVCWWIYNV